jgi:hypothetical protein
MYWIVFFFLIQSYSGQQTIWNIITFFKSFLPFFKGICIDLIFRRFYQSNLCLVLLFLFVFMNYLKEMIELRKSFKWSCKLKTFNFLWLWILKVCVVKKLSNIFFIKANLNNYFFIIVKFFFNRSHKELWLLYWRAFLFGRQCILNLDGLSLIWPVFFHHAPVHLL